jgi:hypothetical protein
MCVAVLLQVLPQCAVKLLSSVPLQHGIVACSSLSRVHSDCTTAFCLLPIQRVRCDMLNLQKHFGSNTPPSFLPSLPLAPSCPLFHTHRYHTMPFTIIRAQPRTRFELVLAMCHCRLFMIRVSFAYGGTKASASCK